MTTTVAAGLLVLRLAVGLTMAAHGYAKIFQGGRLASPRAPRQPAIPAKSRVKE